MIEIINSTELQRGNVESKIPFNPKRVASWWSRLEDIQWPEKRARDMIKYRADALAEANVDAVVQFGFHFRFDFAQHFGAMHGLFADIAENLHERGIKFIDHYSCNLLARPNSEEERLKYHTNHRHHVDLYADEIAAETAGYAGYRFRDLCEVDLVNGGPAYTNIYQAEMMCHNNPDFLAMHAAYLKRLFAEVPLDGVQADDMCIYNFFRSCGCEYCRERFRNEYGHELPPLDDTSFWGDISGRPLYWGNYDNPAFRDWVQMRYQSVAEHVKMVKDVIGPDKALMTCCSASAQEHNNSLALTYEGFVDNCDWVMLENCGLGASTVKWEGIEPVSILQKSITYAKPNNKIATVATSYTVYDDGAYLGWALARYWGVVNWISTLTTGLSEDPGDAKEEAELVAPYNNWEVQHDPSENSKDIVEVRIAYLRANRDTGKRDENGVEYWENARRWALALIQRSICYRFIISKELENIDTCINDNTPIIFDHCACVSDTEFANIKQILNDCGQVWIMGPFGTHDERGFIREKVLLDELKAGEYGESLVIFEKDYSPQLVDDMIEQKRLSPKLKVVGENQSWRARLRETDDNGYTIHLLNHDLEGIEHPAVVARGGEENVLDVIKSYALRKPVKIELRLPNLKLNDLKETCVLSPELDTPRPLTITEIVGVGLNLEFDLSDIKLYGVIHLNLK